MRPWMKKTMVALTVIAVAAAASLGGIALRGSSGPTITEGGYKYSKCKRISERKFNGTMNGHAFKRGGTYYYCSKRTKLHDGDSHSGGVDENGVPLPGEK